MTRIFLVLSTLFLMGAQVSAASKAMPAVIQYVGSVSINPSQDEKVLADWYERFGIQTQEMKDGSRVCRYEGLSRPKIPEARPEGTYGWYDQR